MWTFAISLTLAQAGADAWVDRLSDSDAAVRERAVEWLIENDSAGTDWLNSLAASTDPELRARAEHVLEQRRRRRVVANAFGPGPLIRFEAHNEDAVEVLRRLREISGLPGRLENVPLGRPVTILPGEYDSVEAILEVCRQHGGVSFNLADRTVKPGSPPTALRVVHDRWHVFFGSYSADEEEGTANVSIGLLSTTATAPDGYQVEFAEVTDSRGESYLPDEAAVKGDWLGLSLSRPVPRSAEWIRVAGRVTVRYLFDQREERIPWPDGDRLFRIDALDAYVRLCKDVANNSLITISSSRPLPDTLRCLSDPMGGSAPWTLQPYWPREPALQGFRVEYRAPRAVLLRHGGWWHEVEVPFSIDRVPLTAADE